MPSSRPRRRRAVRKPKRMVKRNYKLRSTRQPVHYFSRTQFAPSAITVNSGVDYQGASSFRLDNLVNSAEFTALYDQYKIVAIKATLMPRGNSMDLGILQTGVSQGNMCRVFSVLDYDDSTPGSINDLMQYQNLKVTDSTKNHVRYLKPRIPIEVTTATGTGTSPQYGWIDCTNNNVLHRGIKYCIQAPANGTQVFDLVIKYYLAFKSVR